MFSVFPGLLTFAIFAPFFLRLAIGVFFLVEGGNRFKKDTSTITRTFGSGEILLALLFILGFVTQIAAAISALYGLLALSTKKKRLHMFLNHEPFVYLFVLAISLTLLVLGVGAFGIDLPL